MGCVSSRTVRSHGIAHKVSSNSVGPQSSSSSVERTTSQPTVCSGCDSFSDAGQSATSTTITKNRSWNGVRPSGPGFCDVTSDVASVCGTIAETVADMRDLADLGGNRGPKFEDHCFNHEDAGSTTEGCRSEAGSSLNGSVGPGSAFTRFSSRPSEFSSRPSDRSPLPWKRNGDPSLGSETGSLKASPFSIDARPHPLGVVHTNPASSRSCTPCSFVASEIGELGSHSEHDTSPHRCRHEADDPSAISVPSIRVSFDPQVQETLSVQSVGTNYSNSSRASSRSRPCLSSVSDLGGIKRFHSSPGIR